MKHFKVPNHVFNLNLTPIEFCVLCCLLKCRNSVTGKCFPSYSKHIEVDIFSDEYMNRINAIQLQNTKIKILQRLLSQAIEEYKKVNKIKGIEFSERLKQVVDDYNNRRRDEAYANEVLDDVAEQLAKLLSELKNEKNSFMDMGIDFEEKAFYDILSSVAKADDFSLVRFDHNKYSVPYQYSSKTITVKGSGNKVRMICGGDIIAEYDRDYHHNCTHYCLEHYIGLPSSSTVITSVS